MISTRREGRELWVVGSHTRPVSIHLNDNSRVYVVHQSTGQRWTVFPSNVGPSITIMENRVALCLAEGWYDVYDGPVKVGVVLTRAYSILRDGKVVPI